MHNMIKPVIELPKDSYPIQSFVLVPVDNIFLRVNLHDIIYLQARGSYVDIFTAKRQLQVSTNLSSLLRQLPGDCLCRISRKHAINLDYLEKVERRENIYVHGQKFRLSDNYKSEFFSKMLVIRT